MICPRCHKQMQIIGRTKVLLKEELEWWCSDCYYSKKEIVSQQTQEKEDGG